MERYKIKVMNILGKFFKNSVISMCVFHVPGALLYVALPPAQAELEQLREFYDPDTVQLMEWINKNTPKTAAFTGSMQLLAGEF